MGVFARLFRRSSATEEASAAEAGSGTPVPGRAAEEGAAEAAGTTGADTVGIPRQQSAGEAVDHEADKGART
ncbi:MULTISPECIES: hypothetical protein [unclassified Streptomyces]|uniref:hypothetical protein n=1 Tax=unclassified Streptomyces TaxID=2593676 RepID=UPI00136F3A7B|nr:MULTISPECIES: hypothetical protein [unclassified Streptomyces]MCW5253365.1 hypothetical protein [Streptomyces sp. SHP 1-2]MYU24975.1 hypothetical protein [Streptomyces sp. SID8352]